MRKIWTVAWTALCVALHYTIGLGLALLLNQKLRGRTLYRLLLIVPWAVPTFVTVFGWRIMLSDGGIINTFLHMLHLPQPSWLEDTFWQRFAAIMVNTWCGVPFMMVSLLGGLQSIDASLYEAARIDGAGPIREFWSVTLPAIRPELGIAIVITVISALRSFDIIYISTQGGPGNATLVPGLEIYYLAFFERQIGQASAMAVVLTLLVLAVVIPLNRVTRTGNEE